MCGQSSRNCRITEIKQIMIEFAYASNQNY